MTETGPKKPTGKTGPIRIGVGGITRQLVTFPTSKEDCEQMIADMFVLCAGRFPDNLPPFSDLKRADGLDFTVTCREGTKYLELVEFAPLAELKVRYATAPKQLPMGVLADLVVALIGRKSEHQGRPDCLLLVYKTHDAFLVPPPVIELVRRRLVSKPPNFRKIYYLSPHDQKEGTIFEVFPGTPHSFYPDMDDDKLANMRLMRADFDQFG